jgi:hypothetical protein
MAKKPEVDIHVTDSYTIKPSNMQAFAAHSTRTKELFWMPKKSKLALMSLTAIFYKAVEK